MLVAQGEHLENCILFLPYVFEKIWNWKEVKGNSGIHLKSFEKVKDPCLGNIALGSWSTQRYLLFSVFDVVLWDFYTIVDEYWSNLSKM